MNRPDFRIILRKMARQLVAGIALTTFFSGASFALGTDDQRVACTPTSSGCAVQKFPMSTALLRA
jgi:hypothetical protein